MPNLFGITEREYIGRSQIYEEYSVKKIAKVDRRSVRVGEANFLSHIYEEYSVKKIAKVDRRSFPLSESLRSLTTLMTLKPLKPPRSACMRASFHSPPPQRLVNQRVSRSCRQPAATLPDRASSLFSRRLSVAIPTESKSPRMFPSGIIFNAILCFSTCFLGSSNIIYKFAATYIRKRLSALILDCWKFSQNFKSKSGIRQR